MALTGKSCAAVVFEAFASSASAISAGFSVLLAVFMATLVAARNGAAMASVLPAAAGRGAVGEGAPIGRSGGHDVAAQAA
eukprot:6968968-Pyramimonas_sp.AAC.1